MSDTKYIQVMRKFIGCLFLIQMYCVCVWGQTPGMEMVETNIRESYLWKLNGHPCLKQKIKHCVNGPASPDIMIRELKEGVDLKAVKRYFQAMQENGSWPDLNYRDDSRSGWQPSFHAERLALLAKAYRYPGGKYFHDKRLSDAIHRGMNYWFEGRFRCPNWWYNQIGVPKMMGCVFLLMVSEMSEAEKTEAIRYMENARLGMTGQNSVWLAENVLVRALLIQDENLFLQARNAILKELKVNETGEGIRPDMSFHQHGAQLQFGNYGLAFANTAVYWARIFHGTEYALTTDQLKILNNYLLEGMQWIVWGGYMDISSCGRQLFWNAQQGKALSLGKALQNMMVADEGNREIYRRFYEEHILGVQDGNSFCGDMYFPYSDFGVHRTSSWSGTVKMSSKRVIGSEIVNAENLSGCYLGDGALYVYQQGNEYWDIFPVWDWTKLPGVTCCEDKEVFGKGYTFSNQHDFVGGVSDGNKSVLAMVQHKNGVKARKSYFFTGNTIVCVGTDIQYAGVYCVTTGVEQNLLQGKVRE